MPLKLNVGLSKKVGLRDYGSLGASCHVEVELASDVVYSDLETFHRHVANAFVACRQAVQDELARNQESNSGATRSRRQREPNSSGNGFHARGNDTSRAGQDEQQQESNVARVSQKQLDYARQLAGQITGLGVRRLETLAQQMFDKAVADLTILDASALIDTLKAFKSGRIDVATALNGVSHQDDGANRRPTQGAAA